MAVSKFEFESLSFTEQNMINESDEPSGSSLHLRRNSVLNFVSLFPRSGEVLLVHCTAVMAIQGTPTHTLPVIASLHTDEKGGH